MSKSFNQFFKYAIVGIIGLIVDFGVYFVLKNYIDVYYVYAHVIGAILAITNNFLLNSYFTFKTTDKFWRRAISFFGIAGVGLVAGTFMLPTVKALVLSIYQYCNVSFVTLSESNIEDLSKLSITAFVAIVQFFFNKYFTFRKKKTQSISEK